MENYYEILEITKDASDKEIKESYISKIKKYNNLTFLNDEIIKKIKLLKKCKYILLDKKLRQLYDKLLSKNNLNNIVENDKKNFNNHFIANRIFDMPRIPNNNN